VKASFENAKRLLRDEAAEREKDGFNVNAVRRLFLIFFDFF
jgi:hypothetical protein